MATQKIPPVVKLTPEEIKRREMFMCEGIAPYNILDPFTWSLPAKMSFAAGIVTGLSVILYTIRNRRPWHASLYPKIGMIVGSSAFMYYYGRYRAYNFASRDAVIDHYMELHPADFERTGDYNGRPYREILLPWYPNRVQYKQIPLVSPEFETPR